VPKGPFWKAALLLYAGLIFWLSSQPLPEGPPLFRFPGGDKLLHFLEYMVFGLLAWRAFLPRDGRGLVWVIFLSLGYAGSDELHQRFVPTRSASLLDWGVDSLGVLSGLYLARSLSLSARAWPRWRRGGWQRQRGSLTSGRENQDNHTET